MKKAVFSLGILIILAGCSWVRMPEPNRIGASIKCNRQTCECRRYSVHSGMWMEENIWYNPRGWEAKHLEPFRKEVCGR